MTRADFWHEQLLHLTDHVVAHAHLDKPGKDGKTPRQHITGLAKRFRAQAKNDAMAAARADKLEAQLQGPEVPVAMRYLLGWLDELDGRSGVTMDGKAPLSWEALDCWARRTGRDPLYHELMALLNLYTLRRNPPPEKPDDV